MIILGTCYLELSISDLVSDILLIVVVEAGWNPLLLLNRATSGTLGNTV